MEQSKLQKYARLLVKTGINIQKGQTLVLSSPIECADFARMVVENAYAEGAKEVIMNWIDEKTTKIKYLKASDEIFDEFPDWQKEYYTHYARIGSGFMTILAQDPELMKDVDPNRMMRSQRAASKAIEEYRDRLMSNKNPWCIASIPTEAWAKKVFPNNKDAVEKLWDAILETVRIDDGNPVEAWESHKAALRKSMDFLNQAHFTSLHFKNSLGTDLNVELPENYVFLGGSEFTPEGIEFMANMPTEEVFSLPKKTGVNGIVKSAMPLNYQGNLVDHFELTFKDGKIVDYKAETGYETLKSIVETDEGSHYLGEVALVPYDSPISNSGILFYNTLFDENASCHLAIGKAYPSCIKGSENMSKEELEKAGVNDSITHVDFMFGTKDLEITGLTKDGKKIPVFRNGNFAY